MCVDKTHSRKLACFQLKYQSLLEYYGNVLQDMSY